MKPPKQQPSPRATSARLAAVLASRRARRQGTSGRDRTCLRTIDPLASLTSATSSIPWILLTQLFNSFADIRGVGFSKMTKALHPKHSALIPMLDSILSRHTWQRRDPGPRSVGLVWRARDCARPRLQRRPGSRPARPSVRSSRTPPGKGIAQRGAHTRHADLVCGDSPRRELLSRSGRAQSAYGTVRKPSRRSLRARDPRSIQALKKVVPSLLIPAYAGVHGRISRCRRRGGIRFRHRCALARLL